MIDELLDYVDENDNVIGQVSRSEIDKKGLIGRIAGVIIYNSDNELMICKNPPHKVPNANKWHFSAIGHVSAGDTPEEAAIREAYEEVGVELNSVKKLAVLRNIGVKDRGRRFIHVFKAKHEGPFTLDANEASEYRFMSELEVDTRIGDKNFFSKDFINFWKIYRR